MNPQFDFSPVSLSYIGALRFVQPRRPGESFTYAFVECREPELLVCLAASNPEGDFYGMMASESDQEAAEKMAAARQIKNITFLRGRPSNFVATAGTAASPLPPLNYLCCDEHSAPLPEKERSALFAMAAQLMLPNGLFGIRYRAHTDAAGPLSFVVQEFAAEMDVAQAQEFLHELKQLGTLYFADRPEAAKQLDDAIRDRQPDRFFDLYNAGNVRSGTFDTMVGLGSHGFAYVGDANVAANYIELSVPVAAQNLVIECRSNPLYEPIKDFALNRLERYDIWCHGPALMTDDQASLFGGFTYGILEPRDEVPSAVETHGKLVDLGTPLFTKLIDLMALMPVGIGDFLSHPDGSQFTVTDVIGAIQILVACGIAKPMRGNYIGRGEIDIARPRLNGSYNQHLEHASVSAADVLMASSVVGSAVTVPPREALVMQAIDRAGLADSVSALLPELQRLAQNPITAAHIMDSVVPTPESAQDMIKDIVAQSIVQWYAYGLLATAA